MDVRPSLDGAPLDLEARDDVMAFCAAEAETVLRRHDDAVIERVPEGLIAVFGARETHEDQGLRAVRAATALQRRLAEVARDVGVQLELRVGVTAGTALVTAPDGLPSGEVVAAATQVARTAAPASWP